MLLRLGCSQAGRSVCDGRCLVATSLRATTAARRVRSMKGPDSSILASLRWLKEVEEKMLRRALSEMMKAILKSSATQPSGFPDDPSSIAMMMHEMSSDDTVLLARSQVMEATRHDGPLERMKTILKCCVTRPSGFLVGPSPLAMTMHEMSPRGPVLSSCSQVMEGTRHDGPAEGTKAAVLGFSEHFRGSPRRVAVNVTGVVLSRLLSCLRAQFQMLHRRRMEAKSPIVLESVPRP
jgi:hypothetical protein